MPYDAMLLEKRRHLERLSDDAIAYDACQTALQLGARLIVAFTVSGSTAGRVSNYRPSSPILGLTIDERIQRLLTLHWGVTPVTTARLETVDDFFAVGEREALGAGVSPGELVVLVTGVPIGVAGGTNLLRILKVPE